MADTTITNIRIELQIFNENVISNASLTLFAQDASDEVKVDDEKAKRYYAAWLASKSLDWNSIKSTGDGVTYSDNKPEYFYDKYVKRLKKLGYNNPVKINERCTDSKLTGDRCYDKIYDPLL